MNKTSVGVIEKAKKAITSLVFSRAPRIFRLRSMKSLPIFRNTSQLKAIRMTILTLSKPKKKIELTNGRLLERELSRNSAKVRITKRHASDTMRIHSRFRLRCSRESRGGKISVALTGDDGDFTSGILFLMPHCCLLGKVQCEQKISLISQERQMKCQYSGSKHFREIACSKITRYS